MNYLIAKKNILIKGIWIFKGSKYTLNLEGYLHSFNDLPAIIYFDGSQSWFLNGELHRSDGPAIIDPNGTQSWYLNGELHRVNGPAFIDSDGSQSWWFNGKPHREDGPAIIDSNGYQAWYLNGELHREDGPALIFSDGAQEWWLNGELVYPIEVLKLLKAKGVDITHFALDKDKEVRKALKKIIGGVLNKNKNLLPYR